MGGPTHATGSFGQRLRQHRLAAALSQEELAERAGLSQRGISDLERGQRRWPHPTTVRRLADALRLDQTERAGLLAVSEARPAPVPRPQHTGVTAPGEQQLPASPGAHLRHGLPVRLTSFVARDQELAEIQRLMAGARLVTLTGPGGIGKTRLALEVASATVEPEAVFVDLALLERTAVVAEAIAVALGVVGALGHDLSTSLSVALQGRAMLLLLDNCEHVVASCAGLVDALLRACPHLRVLTTSREPLGVVGEIVWSVPPLPAPDPAKQLSVAQLGEVAAVRLFLERVRSTLPGFVFGEPNAPWVTDICSRLDGIPLALELAAARVRLLGVEELARRLDGRLRLLVGGCRGLPARQRTLRATLDWSYALLSEPERVLFARLGVFSGGWTLAAAEAVCAGDGIPGEHVLDLLGQLVDRSLVSVAQTLDGGVRYRLLESVREYARECADALGERVATEQRHAAFYRDLAEQADEGIWGPDQRAWMASLTAELGNVRTALEWSARPAGDAELGLRLAAALWFFWSRIGHTREGRVHLARLLARHTAPTWARTWGLHAAANTAWFDGDLTSARAHLDEALLLARAWADARASTWVYTGLGSLALAEGDPPAAQAFLRQGLMLARGVGDPRAVYILLWTLGHVARVQGDLDRAERLLQHSSLLIRAHGDLDAQCWAGCGLGHLALVRGDLAVAASLQLESLALRRTLGDTLGVSHNLDELALVALAAGDLTRATRLFGAAAGHRASSGGAPYPLASAERESSLAAARSGLGEADFDAAWRVGHALSLDAAVEDAAQLAGQVRPSPPSGPVGRAAPGAEAGLPQVPSGQSGAIEDRQLDGEAPGPAEQRRVARYTRQVCARLGKVRLELGYLEDARELFIQGLGVGPDLGAADSIADCVAGLAHIADAQGKVELAARLLGAAAIFGEQFGAPPVTDHQSEHDRLLASVRATLGE